MISGIKELDAQIGSELEFVVVEAEIWNCEVQVGHILPKNHVACMIIMVDIITVIPYPRLCR